MITIVVVVVDVPAHGDSHIVVMMVVTMPVGRTISFHDHSTAAMVIVMMVMVIAPVVVVADNDCVRLGGSGDG